MTPQKEKDDPFLLVTLAAYQHIDLNLDGILTKFHGHRDYLTRVLLKPRFREAPRQLLRLLGRPGPRLLRVRRALSRGIRGRDQSLA